MTSAKLTDGEVLGSNLGGVLHLKIDMDSNELVET